jgi:hypothetical protein
MNHIMLDLETMGNGPHAAITAIGAVAFDPRGEAAPEGFYHPVDLESAMAGGGVVDASTVLWWMQQSDEARAMYSQDAVSIETALRDFAGFVKLVRIAGDGWVHVWGNGAAFDNVILRSAYDRSGMEAPWGYRENRCYRTFSAVFDMPEIDFKGVPHNALDDARYQAERLIAAYKKRELIL